MSGPDFDELYRDDADPWQVATSWYERRKIAVVLATLRRPRYALAWDAGCGTGELAAALAPRVDEVVATDLSAVASALTTDRTAGVAEVRAQRSSLPARPPMLTGRPDLVLLSEVLYYLSPEDREATYVLVDEIAAPDADLVLVHWGPLADDAELTGIAAFNEAAAALNARGWGRIVLHADAEFVLGLFSRDIPDAVGGRD